MCSSPRRSCQRERGVMVAREQPHARGLDGRDHQPRLATRDLPKCGRTLLLDLRVRRKIFKRQHVVRRKPQNLVGTAARRSTGMPRARSRAASQQPCCRRPAPAHGASRRAHEIRKVERPRRGGKSGHTSPPRAAREMATHTLKDWRAFQVRDQLADERKNHAVSSVQRATLGASAESSSRASPPSRGSPVRTPAASP